MKTKPVFMKKVYINVCLVIPVELAYYFFSIAGLSCIILLVVFIIK